MFVLMPKNCLAEGAHHVADGAVGLRVILRGPRPGVGFASSPKQGGPVQPMPKLIRHCAWTNQHPCVVNSLSVHAKAKRERGCMWVWY